MPETFQLQDFLHMINTKANTTSAFLDFAPGPGINMVLKATPPRQRLG